jgi:hypothetical protein
LRVVCDARGSIFPESQFSFSTSTSLDARSLRILAHSRNDLVSRKCRVGVSTLISALHMAARVQHNRIRTFVTLHMALDDPVYKGRREDLISGCLGRQRLLSRRIEFLTMLVALAGRQQ